MGIKLEVDFRERHENSKTGKCMVEVLQKKGVDFDLKQLNVGDYILTNEENGQSIVVERKIISDYVGSIYSGRLGNELLKMEENFSHSFLVLVGGWQDLYKERAKLKKMGIVKNVNSFSVAQRLGSIASICARRRTRLIQVENDFQFVDLIFKLCEKCTDGKVVGDMALIRQKSSDNVFENMLCCVPMISNEKAKRIVESYSSFGEFKLALDSGVFCVEGVGARTLEELGKVFK